jgi:hypothetical protein
MTAKLKESSEFKNISVDVSTLRRLHVLAGPAPVAAYLRHISTELAKDTPLPMEALAGGWNAGVLQQQLVDIQKALVELKLELVISQGKTADWALKTLKAICQLTITCQYLLERDEAESGIQKEDALKAIAPVAEKLFDDEKLNLFPGA